MNERGAYATYLWMLHRICHDEGFWGEESAFVKLVEYGWLKTKQTVAMSPVNGLLPSTLFVLTAKGHLVLSPRENRVEGLPVPFYATKHRQWTLAPDGEQFCILAKELEQQEQTA